MAEGSSGVVADIAKLSVGREEYYTRELATDHEEYLSGDLSGTGVLRPLGLHRPTGRVAARVARHRVLGDSGRCSGWPTTGSATSSLATTTD